MVGAEASTTVAGCVVAGPCGVTSVRDACTPGISSSAMPTRPCPVRTGNADSMVTLIRVLECTPGSRTVSVGSKESTVTRSAPLRTVTFVGSTSASVSKRNRTSEIFMGLASSTSSH